MLVEFLINSNVRWGDLKSNFLKTQFMFLKSLEINLNLHPSKKNVECSMIIYFIKLSEWHFDMDRRCIDYFMVGLPKTTTVEHADNLVCLVVGCVYSDVINYNIRNVLFSGLSDIQPNNFYWCIGFHKINYRQKAILQVVRFTCF